MKQMFGSGNGVLWCDVDDVRAITMGKMPEWTEMTVQIGNESKTFVVTEGLSSVAETLGWSQD